MVRKLAPLAVLLMAACSSSPSGGGPSPGGSGGAGASGASGGRSGTGGGSGGAGAAGAGGSTTGGSGAGSGGAGAGSGGAGGSAGAGSGGAGGSAGAGSGGAGGGAGGGSDAGPAGGSGNPATGYTFGARPQQYPMGSIRPTGTQGELDAVVTAAYDKWKATYVKPDCEGYIVKTTSGLTSSLALGTGMMITAMMAGHDPQAQAVFDGMFAVARKFPSYLSVTVPAKHGIGPRPGNGKLLAYAINTGCQKFPAGDSSVDGDLAFAYALTVADRQWGSTGKVNYLDEAKQTANAIKLYDMSTLKTPLIGDWASLPGEGMWTTVTKPPNFTVGHFRSFAKASGDMYWTQVVDAVQTLIADAQTRISPMTGLFSRYLIGSRNLPGGNTVLGGDDGNSRDYFGECAYIPLWLAADYIGSGDMRSKAALGRITEWLKTKTAGDPTKIVDGYRLNGDNIGTRGTMTYVAPFGAIAAFDAGNQAWLDAIWKLMSAAPTTNQLADTGNLLGMLMVTGNWWQP
jgi:hypothetical protein